ncbi:hypothetical protein CB0940_12035 [Cercospora beticola]|uniref:Protein LURP-one-related 15 n=1 Tax=Cercospora beticola TaxID=122368 RepID=A0A2G5IEG9_CERBT|nr:hypothetical protein CB0940_12035 [Cercospora beticola]PIB03130.1 hypothetical protein CB0940_12035 [Cercospora beticola]WPB04420.1 hypothetical protein RHO25_009066 [Cercospora beticola]CAK1356749.1 unnamed protein product [Cercospora beticola]
MSAPPVPVYNDTTAVPPASASHVNPGHVSGTTHTTSDVPGANASGHVQAPLAPGSQTTAPQSTGLHAKLAQAQGTGPNTTGTRSTVPNTVPHATTSHPTVGQPVGPGATAAHQAPLGGTTTTHTNAPVGATTTTHSNAPLASTAGGAAVAGAPVAGAPVAQPMANRLAASGLPVLQSFQPPLGPSSNEQLYSPQQITLTLTEKVWALGDTFTVHTADGAQIMQVKGKVVSLHGKKKFSDMAGNELFTLAEKKLKLHKTFHAEAPTGHNFDIEGNFSLGSSKSTVKFVNASDKRPMELQVKGDWLDRSAKITLASDRDRVVAQMSRSFLNAREVIGNKQTYFITVAPGVDLSLIAAICVAIDERENDK